MKAARMAFFQLQISLDSRQPSIELDPLGVGGQQVECGHACAEDGGLFLVVVDHGGEDNRHLCLMEGIHQLDIGLHDVVCL